MSSLVNHSVTNLINGVSQQATSVRLDNQLEEQVNCFSDVTKGLTIRNGLELKNVLSVDMESRVPIEFSLDGQKYLLGLNTSDASPLVHIPLTANIDALTCSITDPEYFSGANKKDIKIVEDKDKVYILNTKREVLTNQSNSVSFTIRIQDDSTGITPIDWTTGSYKIRIESVADDTAGTTPSETPYEYTITPSTTLQNIVSAINGNSITNEVGTVSATGSKSGYKLRFDNIPKEFTVPLVTVTELSSITGTSESISYFPTQGGFTYIAPSGAPVETGLGAGNYFLYNTAINKSYGYMNGQVINDVAYLALSIKIGNTTYYRGTLQTAIPVTGGSIYVHSVRSETVNTVTSNYSPVISTPSITTGTTAEEDKYSDKGLIWVTGVSSDQEYVVKINYSTSAGVSQTPISYSVNVGTTASQISLNWVALQIVNYINASVPNLSATQFNNAVYVYSTVPSAYYIDSLVVDNNFDTSSITAAVRATVDNTSAVKDISSLPALFQDGFKIRVGDENNVDSNYYLVYDSDFQGWKEVGLDETRELDVNTMPYVISKADIRSSNTITLKPNDWTKALSGDGNSNKSPSFVDNSINDIFLYGSRLGLATDDSLILSSIGKPDTFFRTTCSQTLTSDRVDILLDSSKIGFAPINSVSSFDSKLFVNTLSSQSMLLVNNAFELTSARLSEVSSYSLGDFPPLPVNNGMYFALSNNGRTNIHNYVTLGNNVYESYNMTKHIPTYIEGNVTDMKYADNFTVVSTDSDKKVLYVQNRYSNGGEILQNSWHRWELNYDVEYFTFIDNNLYIYFSAVDTLDDKYTFICKYDLTPQVISDELENAYIGWTPFLDFYTRDKTLIENFSEFIGINDKYGTLYNSVASAYNSTVINQIDLGALDGPYYSSVSPVYYWQVDGNVNRLVYNDGIEIVTGNTAVKYLDFGGYRYYRNDESTDSGYYEVSRQQLTETEVIKDDIVYGIPFKATVKLSEIVPRKQNQDGSYTVMNYATLMLRRMRLYLSRTGVFQVSVDFQDRNNYSVKYTGQPLGKILLGRNSVADINFKFPINGKSDKVVITITTDSSTPFNLLSAEWQGKLTVKGRNI